MLGCPPRGCVCDVVAATSAESGDVGVRGVIGVELAPFEREWDVVDVRVVLLVCELLRGVLVFGI